jgi:hypothetical protein
MLLQFLSSSRLSWPTSIAFSEISSNGLSVFHLFHLTLIIMTKHENKALHNLMKDAIKDWNIMKNKWW